MRGGHGMVKIYGNILYPHQGELGRLIALECFLMNYFPFQTFFKSAVFTVSDIFPGTQDAIY